jgi:hypothetical protein
MGAMTVTCVWQKLHFLLVSVMELISRFIKLMLMNYCLNVGDWSDYFDNNILKMKVTVWISSLHQHILE